MTKQNRVKECALYLLFANVIYLYGKVGASEMTVNWLSQSLESILSIDLMLWMCWQHKQRRPKGCLLLLKTVSGT